MCPPLQTPQKQPFLLLSWCSESCAGFLKLHASLSQLSSDLNMRVFGSDQTLVVFLGFTADVFVFLCLLPVLSDPGRWSASFRWFFWRFLPIQSLMGIVAFSINKIIESIIETIITILLNSIEGNGIQPF